MYSLHSIPPCVTNNLIEELKKANPGKVQRCHSALVPLGGGCFRLAKLMSFSPTPGSASGLPRESRCPSTSGGQWWRGRSGGWQRGVWGSVHAWSPGEQRNTTQGFGATPGNGDLILVQLFWLASFYCIFLSSVYFIVKICWFVGPMKIQLKSTERPFEIKVESSVLYISKILWFDTLQCFSGPWLKSRVLKKA